MSITRWWNKPTHWPGCWPKENCQCSTSPRPAANRSSDDKLMYKTAIYLRVYLRLSAYSENEITRQKERQAEFQDLRVLHPESNHRETEIEPGPPTTQNVIEVRGRCRKCNAGWQSLREDGTDGWNRPVMVCMICGSENIISLDPEDPDSVDLQALPGLLEPHETGENRPVEQRRLHLPEMRHGEPGAAQAPESPDLLTGRRTP